MGGSASSEPITVVVLEMKAQSQEFEAWIRTLEIQLNAELQSPDQKSKPTVEVVFQAAQSENYGGSEALLELRSKIEENPEFFEISGKPAPEIELFLKSPEIWAEKNLPALHRRAEWIAGRLAACECRRRIVGAIHPAPFRYSITHSDGFVLACGAQSKDGLGIDLERATRSISTAAARRTFSDQEQSLGLSPVELWTIKEATFKALHLQAPFILSQLTVQSCHTIPARANSALWRTGICAILNHPEQTCQFWLLSSPEWTVCFSIL